MDFRHWNVKNYDGIKLTKEQLNKYSFDEIKNSDSKIVKQIEGALENGGVIFGLSKEKIIKAIYFFKPKINGKEKVLVFDKKVVLNVADKVIKEFENDMDTILNEVLSTRYDIDKVVGIKKELSKKSNFIAAIKDIKTFVWVGIIVLCIFSIAITISSTSYSLKGISKNSIDEIENDKSIMNYVSDINNYNYRETIGVISEHDNNIGFVILEIIIPTIFLLFAYILLIISFKRLLDLIGNVSDNKSLFTDNKYQLLKKIIIPTYIALFFVVNFLSWIILGMIFAIIQYMFGYCVALTNENKNEK